MPLPSDILEKRRFVRHPVKIPIKYQRLSTYNKEKKHTTTKDLSPGGISFFCADPLPVGTPILVSIPCFDPPFQVEAVVIHQHSLDQGYEVGVAFQSGQDWFKARLVEQVCHIEAWRQDQESLGRPLSFEEAAGEWIARNAALFCPSSED